MSGSARRTSHPSEVSLPVLLSALQFHLRVYLHGFFIFAADPQGSTNKAVLEPRAVKENCAKKLFSSPGNKRSFTRHPSLIKLAKSIQDDRRKINSAPSSPAKRPLGESSQAAPSAEERRALPQSPWSFFPGTNFPNKMAQLAAICQIELDQEEA